MNNKVRSSYMNNKVNKSTIELSGEAMTGALARSVLDSMSEEAREQLIGAAVKDVLTNNYTMSDMIRTAAMKVIRNAVEAELSSPEYTEHITASVKASIRKVMEMNADGSPGEALQALTDRFSTHFINSIRQAY